MGRWKEIDWTKAEIETLREVWPRESRRLIFERLPNRSWSSCASKASSLKIRRFRPNLAMINFASKNGFMFERHLKEFWGKGTGDAFLLVKHWAKQGNER